MKTKTFSFIQLAFLISVATFATNNAFASGLTNSGTLTSVNSGASLLVKGTMVGNPDSCTDTDAFVLDENNPNYKNIYAALLTAYAADKNIRLFLDGCVDNGAMTKNRAEIGSLLLQ